MSAVAEKINHVSSYAQDGIAVALGGISISLSFLEAVDLVVKIMIGLATFVLICLRIRAHLWPKKRE